nr:MAG: major capsid protein [Microvirus sp.]
MNIFNLVKLPGVKKSKFDLSHDLKMSFRMGELVPTFVADVLPGDVFEIQPQNLLRFAPLVSPVMHEVRITTHYFFVPNRILWPGWESWITGNEEAVPPFVRLDGVEIGEGSLADYMGIPTGIYDALDGSEHDINVLPFAAYAKIYDEYYRDQNLQSTIFEPLIQGANSFYGNQMQARPQKRAWMHDYFTSCLPFAQKGAAVQLPLTYDPDVPVQFQQAEDPFTGPFLHLVNPTTGSPVGANNVTTNANGELQAGGLVSIDPKGTLTVDIQSGATDINTLRRAFRLQEWLERNARGGTRYVESILSHFGVKSSDARLQRPEFIGGMKQKMVISEVLATAQDLGNDQAIGQMAGHGISVAGGSNMRYRAEEHGFIIGIINVQPVTAYQQGIHRMFSRGDRLDYAWPTFANIGEQEVLNKELMFNHDQPSEVFGYIPRYSEYKYMNSRVSGEMRSSLDFWHLGRKFDNSPVLNDKFIACEPSSRIFAIQEDADHIYAHIFNNVNAIRPLPRFGVPTI